MVSLFRRNPVVVTLTCAAAAAAGAAIGLPAVTAAAPERTPNLVSAEGFHWERTVAERRKQRQQARREAARRERARPKVPAALQAIAQCESGGDPRSVSSDGTYRGKYQFSRDTWAAMGGKGDPAKAPEAEQDRRALALYESSGPGQWPTCGQ